MKISIIIPVYNVEKYLRESLNSVLNQTLNDIEVICVDDCSTDNSFNILQEYSNKDTRIKLFKMENNSGPGIVRNKALDVAQGEYILFLDPDDWLDLSACELLYEQASKYNNDLVMFNYCEYFEKTQQYNKISNRTKPFENVENKNNIIIRDCNKNFFVSTFLCFQLYKRSLIEEFNIRFSEHRFCEDDIFVVKSILHSESMSIVPESLYYYRIQDKSLMRSPELFVNVLETKLKCYEYIRNYCKLNNTDTILNFYIDYCIEAFRYYLDILIRKKHSSAKIVYCEIQKIFIKLKNNHSEKLINSLDNYKFIKKICSYNWNVYYFLQLIQKWFYLGNSYDKSHKIIIIAGIKFKVKKNFGKLIKKNYLNNIKNIKSKRHNNEKIKVLFLSNEISKWGYDSLYNLFDNSNIFEPVVGIYPLSRTIDGSDTTQPTLEQQYNFYKQKNINVIYLYENGVYKKIENIKPDIVFYQQQWDLPFDYQPTQVSEYALTCACSYSYEILNDKENYSKKYHSKLFKYYIEDVLNNKRYKKYKGYSNNCSVVGYLKLDKYLKKENINVNKYWKNSEKTKIIYAPHHSLDENDKDCISLATFRENGNFILDYAKSHPETTWVFKPHPRFKYVLEKERIMPIKEINAYYNEWAKLGNIYESGDYLDIFRTSDLMVTDCCSFLAEYLPTGKPLIRMINPNGIKLNKLGQKICSEYYISHNNEELEKFLDQLIIDKKDEKYTKRQKLIDTVIDFNKSAAEKIFEEIVNLINS